MCEEKLPAANFDYQVFGYHISPRVSVLHPVPHRTSGRCRVERLLRQSILIARIGGIVTGRHAVGDSAASIRYAVGDSAASIGRALSQGMCNYMTRYQGRRPKNQKHREGS